MRHDVHALAPFLPFASLLIAITLAACTAEVPQLSEVEGTSTGAGLDSGSTTGGDAITTGGGAGDALGGAVEGCRWLVELDEESCDELGPESFAVWTKSEGGPAYTLCSAVELSPELRGLYPVALDCPVIVPTSACEGLVSTTQVAAESLMRTRYEGETPAACEDHEAIIYVMDTATMDCNPGSCDGLTGHAKDVVTMLEQSLGADATCAEVRVRRVMDDDNAGTLHDWLHALQAAAKELESSPRRPVTVVLPHGWLAYTPQPDGSSGEALERYVMDALWSLVDKGAWITISSGNLHMACDDDGMGWSYPALYADPSRCYATDEICRRLADGLVVFGAVGFDGRLSPSTRREGVAPLLAVGEGKREMMGRCETAIGSSLAVAAGAGALVRLRLRMAGKTLKDATDVLYRRARRVLQGGSSNEMQGIRKGADAQLIQVCDALEEVDPDGRQCEQGGDATDALGAGLVEYLSTPRQRLGLFGPKACHWFSQEEFEPAPSRTRSCDVHGGLGFVSPTSPTTNCSRCASFTHEDYIYVLLDLEVERDSATPTTCSIDLVGAERTWSVAVDMSEYEGPTLMKITAPDEQVTVTWSCSGSAPSVISSSPKLPLPEGFFELPSCGGPSPIVQPVCNMEYGRSDCRDPRRTFMQVKRP